ncbi:Major heat shock protein Ba [Amphibalanus amphitrite]|uniref:Dynein axonemal light chain 1 n=1 Tax=Amphibalanus amphitrite TaxID=1232801 RepID=A0A6A4VCQ1_AMPAM|nr:Major heat shock protein Ba [Amphibalanus amphitrite]
MGRTFDDPKVQEDIKNWPFKVRDDCGQPKVVVEYKGEVKKFTAQEISSMILMKMKSTAEAYLGTERQATKDAAKIAGLEVKRIINEPTAAALAYGLDKKLSGEQNVLVFDLGGGTFDVSILSIADGSTFEVLSTAGDTHLGGGDLDNRMVKYFADEFKRKFKVDPTTSPRAIRKLKMACEQAKRALSSTSVATVEIDSFFEGIYFFSKITRARFEELCIDLFKQTLEPVKQALADAGLKKSDIHEVVLVGGSTRIPKVQNLLEDFFDGRTISKSINPDEAVAYGASVQATILSENPTDAFNDVLLIDVVPLSLGTDVGKHSMATIIERNTRIPVTKSQSFSTGRDYQTAVHVGVYQGERALVKDNHMLGEFVFDGLRSARLGEVSVNVEFSVDTDGILNVSAKEMQTGKVMTKTISNDKSRLSQREIERMLQEAQMFQEEDNARRQAVAALQEFEQYVYSAGRTVEESGGGLSDDERRTVFQLTGEAQRWMDSNTLAEKDEIQHRFEALKQWEERTGQKASEAKEVKLNGVWPPIEKMDSSLGQLALCEKLSLSTNSIDRIANLNALKNLKILSLGRNMIKNLSGLEALGDTLEQLWISYNNIERMKGVNVLRKLTVLYMSNNQVKDWTELVRVNDLSSLVELVFVGNPLEEKYAESGTWHDEAAKRLPNIKRLDGIPIVR